jgi:hypothetical protein
MYLGRNPQRLSGVVTNIGAAMPIVAPRHSWPSRILFGTVFALVVLSTAIVKGVLSLAGASRERRRPAFIADMANRAAGDYVWGRLSAGRELRYTQTLRIRDHRGQQYAARIDGMLVSGSVTPGDHVEVEGRWDGPFFVVTSGFNIVSRTPIQIITR